MNKLYPVKQIYSAHLQEVCPNNSRSGIKNIIGLIVVFNEEELFYSIFDDCFFRLLPSQEELTNNREQYSNRIFVDIYGRNTSCTKSLGEELYERLQIEYISKNDIRKNRKILFGYFSDLDYDLLKTETDVDYEDNLIIKDFIIDTELEYEQKLDRPIMYTDGTRTPSATKRLIK